MEEVDFSHNIVTASNGSQELQVQIKLKNGQNLIWSGSAVSIVLDDVESSPTKEVSLKKKEGTLLVLDDSNHTVVDAQYQPYWVCTPPFRESEPATQLSFALPLPESGLTNTVSFTFDDGTLLFENGQLIEDTSVTSLKQSEQTAE